MRVVEYRAEAASAARHCHANVKCCKSRLQPWPVRARVNYSLFRDASFSLCALGNSRQGRQRNRCSATTQTGTTTATTLASSSGGAQRGSTSTAQNRPARPSPSSGGGSQDPDDDPSSSDSYQIGLDPFSQQLIVSAVTAGAAWAIATWAHLDLAAALRPQGNALTLALELSAPVLVLLLAVVVPRWAPPFKGSELERLQHNYYMTAQVLELYLDFDDDDEDGGSGDESTGRDDGGSGDERARVRRRLRLEQTVGWGTISSGLALMQAFTLQPWNPPTANSVFGLALAGRTTQQLANEFLIRGIGWGLLSTWVANELLAADASDGILFFGKVFGGPDTVKYASGLALVAMALPGAMWEARSVRNFVRASVVGPVRDAAIFCTGNGVDEPAYCDPAGFAMMAARRPANAAPVADVVTRTRAWRSGPESSFSSVSSMGSMDLADLPDTLLAPEPPIETTASASSSTASTTITNGSLPAPSPAASAAPSSSPSAAPPSGPSSSWPSSPADGSNSDSDDASEVASAPISRSPSSSSSPSLPAMGPTLSASSTAFEWDSEDMSVLLKVETLQDKIAFWSSLYYQLLAAFAINGAFLASDCNLLASFGAAWLLRTGPLLLSELRARTSASTTTTTTMTGL